MYLVNIDIKKCTGCGACVDVCPVEYLAVNDGVCEVVGDECQGCESCVAVCPEDAITVQEI
ncbi:indolepyruvate ferredoxin oxidoreductase subunit alpha [Dehalobacterium formicoaceticum]|uniref:4Fe-4S dicluster domain-containing protein n=1 Tax=Dehalobacterium formicoaceticum TaxID=51515 RepID=A0ABT1Y1Y0_9FIRM|nr:4Fe-4S dicluster domain-containing protein [Dehalobacterium formicoaceticum]MCR6544877.1 4Fe-4S dicluster domain-containing protein [Dehalobacterium formicoaceticum]